ncbi:MAG: DMT family transporter [Mesorhizobium sp.]
MNANHRTAYALLITTTLLWGGNAIAGKMAIGHLSPMLLSGARWFLACLVLYAIYHRRFHAEWPAIRASWVTMALLGILGFTVFNAAMYTALHYTSAINVSIEQGAMPMLVFLISYLVFRTSVRPFQVIGLLLSIAGVLVTASHGDFAGLLAMQINIGDAYMLAALFVYAAYTVFLVKVPQISWQSRMIVLCAFASVGAVPLIVYEYASGNLVFSGPEAWAILAYVTIGPSILSQGFYMLAVDMIGSNRTSLFINLVPIFGTLLSILFLGEAFQPYHAVALLLVFGGIWLAETSGARAARHPPEA